MAAEDQHLDQYAHNIAAAQLLAESELWDWAVTALFYSALHLAQAYIVRSGIVAESHRARNRRMLEMVEVRPIVNSYRTLQDESEHARYECRYFSHSDFEAIRDGVFQQVSSHLRSLLGVS